MTLKYVHNQLLLNLRELSLFPERARVVIPSSFLPPSKTGYAAALLKCFLYSFQQSSPSINSPSSPFSPPFLSTFIFHAFFFALAISAINLRSPLRPISFVKSLFPLKDSSLFIPSVYVMPIALSHSILSPQHLGLERTPLRSLPVASAKRKTVTATA